jgi:hypothetical protein
VSLVAFVPILDEIQGLIDLMKNASDLSLVRAHQLCARYRRNVLGIGVLQLDESKGRCPNGGKQEDGDHGK